MLDGTRRIAFLANDELERRLVEETDDVSTRDLVVAGGVAQDKLSVAEGWGKGAEETPSTSSVGIAALAEEIVARGGTLELRVSPASDAHHADPREAIDVTCKS